jgi:hypothetical protein
MTGNETRKKYALVREYSYIGRSCTDYVHIPNRWCKEQVNAGDFLLNDSTLDLKTLGVSEE